MGAQRLLLRACIKQVSSYTCFFGTAPLYQLPLFLGLSNSPRFTRSSLEFLLLIPKNNVSVSFWFKVVSYGIQIRSQWCNSSVPAAFHHRLGATPENVAPAGWPPAPLPTAPVNMVVFLKLRVAQSCLPECYVIS